MSETEVWVGRLIPVETVGTIEETCKKICDDNEWEFDDYYDSWQDVFTDRGDEKYCIIKSKVYKIEAESFTYEDIYKASLNTDGSYSIILKYYNGGCSFNDAATEALNNLEG